MTLIFAVCTGANVSFVHTLLLFAMPPPGTLTQLDPFQYCTSKLVTPYCEKVVCKVGSIGEPKLFCTVKTSISSTVRVPAKSTCSQSGWAPPVASFHPPLVPQLSPRRSPSIAHAGAYAPLNVDDAVAAAPLEARA